MSTDAPGGAARPRRLGPQSAVELALVAVVAGLVGLSFTPVFGAGPLPGLAVPAALGAVAVSALATGVAGWSLSASALASIGVAPAVLAVTAWRVAPTPAAWLDAAAAVPAASSRILSAPLPAPDRPELLVVVAATAWLAGCVSAEAVLRTRSPFAPVAPVVPAVAVPLLLGVSGPRAGVAVTGGLAVACGALALVRAVQATGAGSAEVRRARRRRLALALPMVVVAGAVPAALGDSLPLAAGEARVDPRAQQTAARQQIRNPLAEVSAQRHAPVPEEVFTAVASGDVELWRLAALDSFDGATWESSAVFEPVGTRLPEPPAITGARPVRLEVTLGSLDSPFLVAAGRPVEVRGADVRFDSGTGALLADEPVGDGDGYTVDALLADPSDDDLRLATRDRSGADAVAAREPVADAGPLAEAAIDEVTTRSAALEGSADIRNLRALQDFFADQGRFRLATEPTGGLSLGHLSAFVGAGRSGGPGEASIEQFAAAYAVMARTLGYATRVAVGYRTPEPGPDGTYHVTTRDAFAWAEVKLDGHGWVPFLAAPVSSDEAPPPPPGAGSTTTTAGPSAALPDAPAGSDPSAPPDGGGRGRRAVPMAAAVVAGLGAIALAGAPAVRWRRRRRRRRGGAAGSIDGAWREVLDGLAAHRVPVTRSMTAAEVLSTARGHLDADLPGAAAQLARAANEARYGPVRPQPGAVDAAWRRADELLRWVRGRVPRRARWRARLDLRAAVRGVPAR